MLKSIRVSVWVIFSFVLVAEISVKYVLGRFTGRSGRAERPGDRIRMPNQQESSREGNVSCHESHSMSIAIAPNWNKSSPLSLHVAQTNWWGIVSYILPAIHQFFVRQYLTWKLEDNFAFKMDMRRAC